MSSSNPNSIKNTFNTNIKYGEERSSLFNGAKYRVGPPRYYTRVDNRPPFREKRLSLEELMDKYLKESARRRCQEDDDLPSKCLPCQLPPKEVNLGSFTLPCTIGSLDFYAMADLGASINIMRKSMLEHLKLANLKKTNMLVEMVDMTMKVPLGVVENILVKIDKFLVSLDFIIINMLKRRNETMILDRPFLATIHATIDIFNKEISLGIKNDSIIFDMDKKNYKFTTLTEKAYMVNTVHSKDYLFLYESESCEFNCLLAIDHDIFTYEIDIEESYDEIAYRCCMIAQGKPGIDKTENETGSYSKEVEFEVIVTHNHVVKMLLQVYSLETLTRFNSSTWATKWFKRLVAYTKCNCDSYERDTRFLGRRLTGIHPIPPSFEV
ncbi:putative ribonuclease H-like domain-containing protein [Tanacetum coccineum]